VRLRAAPLDPRCAGLLSFWLGDAVADADVFADKGELWFRSDPAVDADIRARFSRLRECAIGGLLDAWLDTPHGALGLILLVDQFSRNLFRGDAEAFAHDALARRWCERALARGDDRGLRPVERLFVYLPLQHAESIADQQHAVALFTQLRDSATDATRPRFEENLQFALRHRDVILRFGRFPHRNVALGRPSTVAEMAYLTEPGVAF
jgi:uncharacterized protein (DUF924 family)